MTNTVTFNIPATQENAELIHKVSELVIPGYTRKSPVAEETAASTKSTQAAKKDKPAKEETPEDSGAVDFTQFKKAAKEAKKEHGEEFCMEILEAAGYESKSTLGRSLAQVESAHYETIIAAWSEGPQDDDSSDDEDLDDDFDDEEDDEPEVEVPAVKKAVKAFAKEKGRDEAKQMMKKYGCDTLKDVEDLDSSDLVKLFKAVSK